ncbi:MULTISPECIES: glutamate--cysteine ligase [Thalassospira]|jgi:glutamate--cysteine ligase|uniref:glutamate--cysteine ligase n=1 Tax=Thalassospira TaxID=168934 RepID=UPI000EE7ED37|nr:MULTISPECIES: glutamate--cysteine ligase [Thalassospira]MBO6809308.1 glutamate--cysteine ligase [Thalassospira sp.]MBO6842439.1 glutamate--cysteine ligase [Thalassospira sp.]MBS8275492.1 glutamate--cysteine ligase [Thalassospira tepidiphila]HCK20478.1 glutamate--cysteine ligase [Thalassospira sp.]
MTVSASTGDSPVIESRRQLVEWFESGSTPKKDWAIGTEHEKFAYTRDDLRPIPYEGERSVKTLLTALAEHYDWEPIVENGNVIALTKDKCSVSLEPGGQIELSGAPLKNIHQTCGEVHTHLHEVREICDGIGIDMLGVGHNPKWKREDIPWMPKGRYGIMKNYMPKVGNLGLDMMLRTSTIQVNLDFSSEADMVKKFKTSLALQPVATALFAASPFVDGKPSGFLSARSNVWTDTDPDRCGMLPFVFEDGFGFERYVDYMLDVPMYFVYRDGKYIDAAGKSFRDFMDGKLDVLPGERPTMNDWSDHMTTAFPEVRLKKFLEMRGADGGPWKRICALPALWVGLLYDDAALDAAWDLVKDLSVAERETLRNEVPRTALATPFKNGTVQDLSKEVLAIARQGLQNRGRMDGYGDDESHFLDSLDDVAESGRTLAEEFLDKYETEWNGSVDPLFKEYAY